MACCGNARGATSGPPTAPGRRAGEPVVLEYGGTTPLTMFGRVTGVRYHFPGPGARLRVDARDAPALALVLGIEPVRAPS
jgi:hypothetical protein